MGASPYLNLCIGLTNASEKLSKRKRTVSWEDLNDVYVPSRFDNVPMVDVFRTDDELSLFPMHSVVFNPDLVTEEVDATGLILGSIEDENLLRALMFSVLGDYSGMKVIGKHEEGVYSRLGPTHIYTIENGIFWCHTDPWLSIRDATLGMWAMEQLGWKLEQSELEQFIVWGWI